MSDTIRVYAEADWRKIVLNRPDKLNAVNEDICAAAVGVDGRDTPGHDEDARAAQR